MTSGPDQYQLEADRRISTTITEISVLKETVKYNEKLLARIEESNSKLSAGQETITTALNRLLVQSDQHQITLKLMIDNAIDEKMKPVLAELALRKEEVTKIKTIIGVLTFIGTCLWTAIVVFKESILSWFRR